MKTEKKQNRRPLSKHQREKKLYWAGFACASSNFRCEGNGTYDLLDCATSEEDDPLELLVVEEVVEAPQ